MPRRASILAGAAATTALAAGATAAALATRRRWQAAADPCGPDGLKLPDGETMKLATDDGAILRVHVAGPPDGRPVVMAHGWTESLEVWAPVGRRLVESGDRVVLYDQRGHGESTFGDDGFGPERLGQDMGTILEQLDLHDAVLVGHSMGGVAVQQFVVDHPDVAAERVSALVLVSTFAFGVGGHPTDRVTQWFAGSAGIERAFTLAGPVLTRSAVGKVVCYPHVRYLGERWINTPAEVRKACVAGLQTVDLRTRLAKLSIPTTVVVGSRDTLTPPRMAGAIAGAIPNARLVEVPGAGHMLPFEAPDRVADLIVGAA
jgi:pimeloyl-ACP methyl ester carboxylesterase